MTSNRTGMVRAAILAAFVLAGCSKSAQIVAPNPSRAGLQSSATNGVDADKPRADRKGDFVPGSDNPYFPLVPGTSFHYRSETADGIETEDMMVTGDTKRIQGVNTIVVKDIVRLDGEVIERTFDYYAMDQDGNVWYFGEDARSIDPETGEVSTEGSWLAGRNHAEAGIIMEADPKVGDAYNEENAPDVAEDQARVIAIDAKVKVPFGQYDDCLHTENFTPLEPGSVENKFYARGVGLVLEIADDGKTRNELVSVDRSRSNRGDQDDDDGEHLVKGHGGRKPH